MWRKTARPTAQNSWAVNGVPLPTRTAPNCFRVTRSSATLYHSILSQVVDIIYSYRLSFATNDVDQGLSTSCL
jgi:hypothetical protein